jgi:hypothetical protein
VVEMKLFKKITVLCSLALFLLGGPSRLEGQTPLRGVASRAMMLPSFVSVAIERPINSMALFKSVLKIFDEIRRICPEADCFLVGVGRSPTPFMALAQIFYPNYSSTLPLSSFGHELLGGDYLGDDELTFLKKHILAMVNPPRSITRKRIVLLDYTSTGKALVSLAPIMREVFPETLIELLGLRGGKVSTVSGLVGFPGLVEPDLSENAKIFDFLNSIEGIKGNLIDIKDANLALAFGTLDETKSFESVAEYSSFRLRGQDVLGEYKRPLRRENFDEFKKVYFKNLIELPLDAFDISEELKKLIRQTKARCDLLFTFAL